MTANSTPTIPHESGTELHRRETRIQIYLPFAAGLLLILIMVLIVALPSNPIWRVRAQAIADWTYTIFCLVPMVMCVFPLFMLIVISNWGMYRLHGIAETPLRKLENLAAGLATRITNTTEFIQRKTIDVNVAIEPAFKMMDTFENGHEEVSNVPTE